MLCVVGVVQVLRVGLIKCFGWAGSMHVASCVLQKWKELLPKSAYL